MSVRTHLCFGRGRALGPGRGLVFDTYTLSRRLGVDLSRKAGRGGCLWYLAVGVRRGELPMANEIAATECCEHESSLLGWPRLPGLGLC